MPTGDPGRDNSCNGVFDGSRDGSVVKTTSSGPNGGIVAPGQTITATLTWDSRDFGWAGPAKTEDCVTIGSHVSQLTQEHPRAPLNGTDTFSYVVPADTGGQPICDRGVVWGYGGHGSGWDARWSSHGQGDGHGDGDGDGDGHGNADGPEKSNVLCYTVLGAATPEAPMALLIPMTGLLVAGAVYLVARRRRGIAGSDHSGGMSLNLLRGRRATARGPSGP
jgi:hypothetical protein